MTMTQAQMSAAASRVYDEAIAEYRRRNPPIVEPKVEAAARILGKRPDEPIADFVARAKDPITNMARVLGISASNPFSILAEATFSTPKGPAPMPIAPTFTQLGSEELELCNAHGLDPAAYLEKRNAPFAAYFAPAATTPVTLSDLDRQACRAVGVSEADMLAQKRSEHEKLHGPLPKCEPEVTLTALDKQAARAVGITDAQMLEQKKLEAKQALQRAAASP
jgi:hypothetical protein